MSFPATFHLTHYIQNSNFCYIPPACQAAHILRIVDLRPTVPPGTQGSALSRHVRVSQVNYLSIIKHVPRTTIRRGKYYIWQHVEFSMLFLVKLLYEYHLTQAFPYSY